MRESLLPLPFSLNFWYTLGMKRKAYLSDGSDEEWNFVAPYCRVDDGRCPTTRARSARSLQWIAVDRAYGGAVAHDASRFAAPSRRSINRRSAGWTQESLKRLSMICERFCGWLPGERPSHLPRSLTAERCNRPRKVGIERAMTERNGARGAKCIWLSIRSESSWHFM